MERGRPGTPIICINDGTIYDSITSASIHYGMSRNTISKQLTGLRGKANGLYFMYVNENMSQEEIEILRKEMLEKIYNIKNI